MPTTPKDGLPVDPTPQRSGVTGQFYLTVFGGLSLKGPGGSLGSTTGKRRLVLLATLAASGERGIPRDTLGSLFWPESDEARARGALKQAVYALRTELGPSAIPATTTGYALSEANLGSDLYDFRRTLEAGELERAVTLYSGPFLAGVHLDGAGDLEEWIEKARANLEADYRGALLTLLTGTGHSPEKRIEWGQRLLALDRGDARSAHLLVVALTAAGRVGQARRAVDEYERWVRDELGGTPDPSVGAGLAGPTDARLRPASRPHGANAAPTGAPWAAPTQPIGPPELDGFQDRTSADDNGTPRRHLSIGILVVALALVAFGTLMWRRPGGDAGSQEYGRVIDTRHVAKHPVYLRVASLDGDSVLSSAALVLGEALAAAIPRAPAFLAVFRAPEDSVRLARLPGRDTMAAPFDVTAQLSFVADSVMVFFHAKNRANPGFATTATLAIGTRTHPLARLDDTVERLLGALARRSDNDSLKTLVDQPPPRYDSYSRMRVAFELAHSDWDPPRFLPLYESAYRLDGSWFLPLFYAVRSTDGMEEFERGDSLLAEGRRRMAGLPDLLRQLETFADSRAQSRGATGPASLPPAETLLKRQPNATGAHLYYIAGEYYMGGRPAEAAQLLAQIDTAGGVLSTTDGSSYWLRSLSLHSSGQYAREMELAEYRFEHPGSGLSHREYFDYMRAMAVTGRSSGIPARFANLPDDVVEREQYVINTFTLAGEAAFHGDAAVARTLLARLGETCEQRARTLAHYRQYCALAHIALGDTLAARLWVERIGREPSDRVNLLGIRGMLAAATGKDSTVQEVLRELSGYVEHLRYGRADLWRARILALSGDREGAIAALADAKDSGWFPFYGFFGNFHWFPELASLKDDPRVRPYWIVDGPASAPTLEP
jgi:DNA-binding SARP family transcriptional activator